jgi:hypothetical protein
MPPGQEADAFIWIMVFLDQSYHLLGIFEAEGGAGLEYAVAKSWIERRPG